jgi:hypothetical protein
LPIRAISDSGRALANMNSGHVKCGPFSFRKFHSCHCSGVSSRVSVTPMASSSRVSWRDVKIEGMKKANRPRRSTS